MVDVNGFNTGCLHAKIHTLLLPQHFWLTQTKGLVVIGAFVWVGMMWLRWGGALEGRSFPIGCVLCCRRRWVGDGDVSVILVTANQGYGGGWSHCLYLGVQDKTNHALLNLEPKLILCIRFHAAHLYSCFGRTVLTGCLLNLGWC